MSVEALFDSRGILSQALPSYEPRSQQVEMAKAVEKTINEQGQLIVEAGTGVGKSLAYLIPFILWAAKNKKKAVISTYTKTLQQQLIKKDIPVLAKHLGVKFASALCVGVENYLCLRRFSRTQLGGLFDTKEEVRQLHKIIKWQKRTKTGLKSELGFKPIDSLWQKICRLSDLCMGKNCLQQGYCYWQRARKRQFAANLLIVNHHLFFANLVSEMKVLPQFDGVVFDEAQNLENVATDYLGIEISNFRLAHLLDTLLSSRTGKGLLTRIKSLKGIYQEELIKAVNETRQASNLFFQQLLEIFGDSVLRGNITKRKRIREKGVFPNFLDEPLAKLAKGLEPMRGIAENDEEKIEIEAATHRCLKIQSGLKIIIDQALENYVYWIEIVQRQRFYRQVLHATPIDVSEDLRREVFDKIKPIVLTSATLATNKSFDYIKSRIGLKNCPEFLLDSPFDYQKQAVLYIPPDVPDPKLDFNLYQSRVIEEAEKIVRITEGKAFLLFTSFEMLGYVYEKLKERLPEMNFFRQGEKPRHKLVEEFKATQNSVLFGTNTFWQGIDVLGRALECVIITKLPFDVPDDPVIEAKMEQLQAKGKNPFLNYQVPNAIIMFKQGFGRLIRHRKDIGIVAIFDPRVKIRRYGSMFLNSLPQCREVDTINELEEFYIQLEKSQEIRKMSEERNEHRGI